MSEVQLDFNNLLKIGENDYGYWFAVGQISDVWYGFAVGKLEGGNSMLFFLPGCDEEDLSDEFAAEDKIRDELIKRVGAIAQSGEHGYGGIKRWFVDESLRGKPEDFMCSECGSVGCSPENHSDDYYFE